MNDSRWLNRLAKNVYSQTGEDGVIEGVLDILPHKDSGAASLAPLMGGL